MDRVTLWAIRAGVALVALLVIGAVVGGVLYGPRLSRALTAAAQGKADTAVATGETEYQSTMADTQARTQAAEVAVTVQLQESTRDVLASPGADSLVSPDLHDAGMRGVRLNRARTPPGGAGAAGPDATAGTAGAE